MKEWFGDEKERM